MKKVTWDSLKFGGIVASIAGALTLFASLVSPAPFTLGQLLAIHIGIALFAGMVYCAGWLFASTDLQKPTAASPDKPYRPYRRALLLGAIMSLMMISIDFLRGKDVLSNGADVFSEILRFLMLSTFIFFGYRRSYKINSGSKPVLALLLAFSCLFGSNGISQCNAAEPDITDLIDALMPYMTPEACTVKNQDAIADILTAVKKRGAS